MLIPSSPYRAVLERPASGSAPDEGASAEEFAIGCLATVAGALAIAADVTAREFQALFAMGVLFAMFGVRLVVGTLRSRATFR